MKTFLAAVISCGLSLPAAAATYSVEVEGTLSSFTMMYLPPDYNHLEITDMSAYEGPSYYEFLYSGHGSMIVDGSPSTGGNITSCTGMLSLFCISNSFARTYVADNGRSAFTSDGVSYQTKLDATHRTLEYENDWNIDFQYEGVNYYTYAGTRIVMDLTKYSVVPLISLPTNAARPPASASAPPLAATPLPASSALLLTSLLGAAAYARKRRRSLAKR